MTGRANRAFWCAILAALVFLCGAARPARAADWREGTVELSSGERISGQVYIPGSSLYLYVEAEKKRYTVRADQLKAIDVLVEKESMEEKWLFKEDGRDEKVYTGEFYPVRHFRTRVTYHDGGTLEGHSMAKTVYVKTPEETHRFRLLRKWDGKIGESLDDLVYVRQVAYSGEGEGALGRIAGSVILPEGEKLKKILAVNRDEEYVLEGRIQGTTFRFEHCTAGTYDLLVVTDGALYVYFSREGEEDCERFTQSRVAGIQEWADKLNDFFHRQDVVYAAGNDKEAWVLIRKERYGGTSYDRAGFIRRYAVWKMHRPEDEWQIKKRFYVNRQLTEAKEVPRENIVISPILGGHGISAESSELMVELALAPTKEPPIPPDPEEEECNEQ